MKILFLGGGTGGHFYPIIAVAESVRKIALERKIIAPQTYYMAPTKYNPRALFDNNIEYIHIPAGKVRRYFSLLNITDAFKTLSGIVKAVWKMFTVYPDVIFSKGGYASFPPLVAARILHIPVIVHESDSKPGRVNAWSAKFAEKVAVSYPEAAKYFKTDQTKIAHTGNPIRKDILTPLSNGAYEYFGLEKNVPTVVILGGSQGAQLINDTIITALPEMLEKYQVIHQTGRANIEEIKQTSAVVLREHKHASRYHPFDYLNELMLRMSAGVANVIVTRAGSTIFEIAAWGIPSIIIPLSPEVSHDQTTNAYAYGRTGAGSVIQENNLSAHVLLAEINRICENSGIADTMRAQAKLFAREDSAGLIGSALLDIALSHEK
ncbi:MAG: UDP-N-acetylglucosamine--N-acetylmuramyl-(pentapeptide) pyrophosphoryl-undecaprenol N-acetylglucosamine transferase [Candidatus Paceibacterota bacterium]